MIQVSRRAISNARSLPLFLLTYRCVMSEISGVDKVYAAAAWEMLEAAAPGGEAERLFGGVFAFARALMAATERPLGWRRTYCAHLCRDEWLAVAMIEAAQRADPVAVVGYASTLSDGEALGDVLHAAQVLAAALSERGVDLRGDAPPALVPDDPDARRVLH